MRADPRQFDLFAAIMPLRAPAIIRPVEPNGAVIQGNIDEVLTLPHPRMAWSYATIELHRHTDGLWMWATNYHDDQGGGGGYRVGPKWGNFAQSREDALFYAAEEVRGRMHAKGKLRDLIERWLGDITFTEDTPQRYPKVG